MSTTVILFSVILIFFAGLFVPRSWQWITQVSATLVVGLGVFSDTPAFPWPAKLAAWLLVAALVAWRLLRERSPRVDRS